MFLRSTISGVGLVAVVLGAGAASRGLESPPAILGQGQSIRAGGPEAFGDFFAAHQSEIELYRKSAAAMGRRDPDDPAACELIRTLDEAAQQRDAAWSGLFWFTDLEEATAEAARTNRPILTLRLLGRLTDEFSCANSRFFRVALYANEEVSAYLREHYVLHWESVRPVPRVTVDFGDGRVIEQTITGNSIHYILASDGSVVDAIPGLYSPDAFLQRLQGARAGAEAHRGLEYPAPEAGRHCDAEYKRLNEEVQSRIQENAARVERVSARLAPSPKPPMAIEAGLRARSKSGLESRVLTASLPPVRLLIEGTPLFVFTDPVEHGTLFDARSRELMRAQIGTGAGEMFETMVARLERSIADDTAWNEYSIRREILGWLREAQPSISVEALNERVYSSLFLTPSSDPWMGLWEPSTFSALWGGAARLKEQEPSSLVAHE